MDLKDFTDNFDLVDICNLPSPSDTSNSGGGGKGSTSESWPKWMSHAFHGKWKRGVTAGGRPSCKGLYICFSYLKDCYILSLYNHFLFFLLVLRYIHISEANRA